MWHTDPAHFDIPTGRSQRMAGRARRIVKVVVHVWSMSYRRTDDTEPIDETRTTSWTMWHADPTHSDLSE
jgi:hypothetical protein